MLSAQFTTHYPLGRCPAPASLGTLEKEMSDVKKSVRFYSGKSFFKFFTLLPPLSIVIPEPIGCQSDQECSRNEACDNRNCINPCVTSNPCSSNAACYVENHRAKCRCPPGFTGDPFRQCVLSKFMHCFSYCQKAISQTFHF